MALRVADRLIFRSRGQGGLPEVARAVLVILAGIALSAVLAAVGYGVAALAGLN